MIKPLTLILCIFFIVACQKEKVLFSKFESVPQGGWPADSALSFRYESDQAGENVGVLVHLRHNSIYPFSNLFLFREIWLNGEKQFGDTIEIELADDYGRWNGKGIGSVKSMDFPFRNQKLRLESEGLYTFTFQHGMRIDSLQGIEKIGITILQIEDGE